MNREEYMGRLAELLQDVPVEERVAAMQYYNDYFDDAGEENEERVIRELGAPEKVAEEVKAGLGKSDGTQKEFRETGYTDTAFEQKESPTTCGNQGAASVRERKPWTNNWVKIILIVLVVLAAAPVAVPIVLTVLAVVAAFLIGIAAVFVSLVIAAAAIVIAGGAMFLSGVVCAFVSFPTALLIMGSGLICVVLGAIGTVVAVRLCTIVLPCLIRFVVEICRKPFYGRKAGK